MLGKNLACHRSCPKMQTKPRKTTTHVSDYEQLSHSSSCTTSNISACTFHQSSLESSTRIMRSPGLEKKNTKGRFLFSRRRQLCSVNGILSGFLLSLPTQGGTERSLVIYSTQTSNKEPETEELAEGLKWETSEVEVKDVIMQVKLSENISRVELQQLLRNIWRKMLARIM